MLDRQTDCNRQTVETDKQTDRTSPKRKEGKRQNHFIRQTEVNVGKLCQQDRNTTKISAVINGVYV